MQRLEREGRVAHPGEAVVPVALAARRLGQGGRQRRHRRPGRHVGESLDRQRRALDRVAPAVVREAGPPEPPTPEPRRRREPGVGLVDVLRRRQLLGPRERAVDLVALLDHVPGPHPVTLDADRHVGLEPDRLTCPARIGRVAVLADQRPLRRHAAVVEDGLADQLDLDPAVEAQDRAHQHVVAVVVGRRPGVGRDRVLTAPRPHGEGVAHEDPPGRRLPGRQQGVGPRLVPHVRRVVDAERPEPERAGSTVEQRAEHARRVEARNAQPVDRPVGGDERTGVAVGQERVVRDRGEGRRRGGALRLRLRRGVSARCSSPQYSPVPAVAVGSGRRDAPAARHAHHDEPSSMPTPPVIIRITPTVCRSTPATSPSPRS